MTNAIPFPIKTILTILLASSLIACNHPNNGHTGGQTDDDDMSDQNDDDDNNDDVDDDDDDNQDNSLPDRAPTDFAPTSGATRFKIHTDDIDAITIDATNGTFTMTHFEGTNVQTNSGSYDPATGEIDPTPSNPGSGDEFKFSSLLTAPQTSGYNAYIIGTKDQGTGKIEDPAIIAPTGYQAIQGPDRAGTVTYSGDLIYMDGALADNQLYRTSGTTVVNFDTDRATTEFTMVTSGNPDIRMENWELGLVTDQQNRTGTGYVNGVQVPHDPLTGEGGYGWVMGDVMSHSGTVTNDELLMNFTFEDQTGAVDISGTHIAK